MLLLYSPYQTPRLSYILNFFLNILIGCEFRLTTDIDEFLSCNEPRLNYSDKNIYGGIWISSSGLLLSKEIINFRPEISKTSWGNIIFPAPKNKEVPFDIFSASFYLVSRYEEYLSFKPDEHGRFSPQLSVASEAEFLSKPIINIWAKKLSEILVSNFPELTFNKPEFNFISTIDIDNAFAYKGKGFIRNTGGFFISILKGRFDDAKNRLKVHWGNVTDPYDNYDFILQIHSEKKLNAKVFILSGKYGKFDKNVKMGQEIFSHKIKELSNYCEIGIHPSYKSNFTNTIFSEKLILEKVIEKNISISRQHYLMLKFPGTYQKLIETGIRADYSMGYSQVEGYRAGTCSPFYFFDLKNNKQTELLVYPFAWMDRTLRQHLKLSPDEAKEFIAKNISEIKKLNGTYVSLWHNESLGDTGYWKGWKSVFEYMINKIN